ncbi:DsbA family oxidoreductase [Caballeronia hypogeia]|uniref:DsbA family oxidoreductase n=1 Tax=Caballeronia hypogeia TaxID=1777140 RepID=UPI0009408051
MRIDVFFDFICPWCLICSRHLSAALARFAELHADENLSVTWRLQQLLPDRPPRRPGVPGVLLSRTPAARKALPRGDSRYGIRAELRASTSGSACDGPMENILAR